MNRTLTSLLVLASGCADVIPFTTRPAGDRVETPGAVLVVVRVKPPWYATRGLIAAKFKEAVPEYEGLSGLQRKYFTIADDGRYGGVYLWRSRAAAEAYFDEAWKANVRERRGSDAELLFLEVHEEQSGPALINGAPAGQRAVVYPAVITLTRGALELRSGVVRGWSVTLSDGSPGAVLLWASREAQRAGVTSPLLTFEAPVLLDDELRLASRASR